MAKIFQIRRGKHAKIPVLAQGEFGMTTDEPGLYLGTGAANIRIASLGASGTVPPEQLPPLDYIPMDQKGAPNGVAVLGPDGKIPKDSLQPTDDALTYGKTNGENGKWDKLTSVPTGTQPIRYNGYLRATRVLGMYFSDSADYAEAYHVVGGALPGDLIAITEQGLAVNTVPENPAVLGFVSDSFATLIGVDGEHETPIALMGRVRVKVCGPVRAGEYLTGSIEPGAVQGVTGCPPQGSIVGQALETDLSMGPRRVWAFVVRM